MLLQMKKYSAKLLMPLAEKLQGIQANWITILSCLASIGSGMALALNSIGIAIGCIFFIEIFDQLDGIVARLQGPTKLGAFLDSTLDRIGDAAIYFGIFAGHFSEDWIVLGAFLAALLTSYTRARIEALGIQSLGGVGLLERTDRIPIVLLAAILQIWIGMSIHIACILLLIGGIITVIQRIRYAIRHLKPKK